MFNYCGRVVDGAVVARWFGREITEVEVAAGAAAGAGFAVVAGIAV